MAYELCLSIILPIRCARDNALHSLLSSQTIDFKWVQDQSMELPNGVEQKEGKFGSLKSQDYPFHVPQETSMVRLRKVKEILYILLAN